MYFTYILKHVRRVSLSYITSFFFFFLLYYFPGCLKSQPEVPTLTVSGYQLMLQRFVISLQTHILTLTSLLVSLTSKLRLSEDTERGIKHEIDKVDTLSDRCNKLSIDYFLFFFFLFFLSLLFFFFFYLRENQC